MKVRSEAAQTGVDAIDFRFQIPNSKLKFNTEFGIGIKINMPGSGAGVETS